MILMCVEAALDAQGLSARELTDDVESAVTGAHAPHRLAQEVLLFGEVEVHSGSPALAAAGPRVVVVINRNGDPNGTRRAHVAVDG